MDVLFVGNGLNRCANIVPGWDTLFSSAVDIPAFHSKRGLTPTLEYEQNVHAILKLAPHMKSGDIKKAIARYLTKKQKQAPKGWQDVIHRQLLACAPQTILTTNYDYFLELAIDGHFKPGAASTEETLYSKERYREVGSHRIYHIHGEASGPASICLGYEQYVGSIQYTRAEIVKSTDKAPNRFHLADVLNGQAEPIQNRWYYHMFLDDVYILGFSLDAAELDIWWLLNYRAKLKQEHPDWIKNKIVYLETDSPMDALPGDDILKKLVKEIEYADFAAGQKKLFAAGESLSSYWNKKHILEQKHDLLATFEVAVEDCTRQPGSDGEDIFISDFRLRYEYALEKLKHGDWK